MLRNYLVVAFRNLNRSRGYAAINVVGLAFGLACCVLLLRYVRYETGYDRFHTRAERIYRVLLDGKIGEYSVLTTTTAPPLAAALVDEVPEVEAATRVQLVSDFPVRVAEQVFNEKRVLFADRTLWDVFSFPLVAGDEATALQDPYTVVVTQSTARRYFGGREPVGQQIEIWDHPYTVTGVVEDVPDASHVHFDLLVSMTSNDRHASDEWGSNFLQTYVLLRPGATLEAAQARLPGLVERHVAPMLAAATGGTYDQFVEGGGRWDFSLMPLLDIHLHGTADSEFEPNGSATTLYVFSGIALFVLLLACVNFMNLATARSASRAREIGIRKAIGSNRGQLVRQFLAESTLMSLASLVLALALVEAVRPLFNRFAETHIPMGYVSDPLLLPALFGLALLVGLVAGSYPALYLSGLEPVGMLKGGTARGGNARLRNGLVVFQFGISIILLVGTGVVYTQLRYMTTRDLGFDREHVLVVPQAQALHGYREAFMDAVRALPGVVSVADASQLPGTGDFDRNVFSATETPDAASQRILSSMNVGYELPATLGMEVVAGRAFSRDFPTDTSAYVINQSAARALGWTPETAVGRQLYQPEASSLTGSVGGEVVGVVKDFHYESLHATIEPVVLSLVEYARYVTVRVGPGDVEGTLAGVRQAWAAQTDQPFEFSFLDQDFDRLYRADRRVGQLVLLFSGLAIVIACLGLFGLASFAAEQRRKEIGVRKVLGASVPSLVLLFSRDFLKLVAVALVLAAPVAWWGLSRWLEGFAYRITLGPGIFVAAGLVATLVALATVSWQALRTATADPVKSLRSE